MYSSWHYYHCFWQSLLSYQHLFTGGNMSSTGSFLVYGGFAHVRVTSWVSPPTAPPCEVLFTITQFFYAEQWKQVKSWKPTLNQPLKFTYEYHERGKALLFTLFNYEISIHTCNFGSQVGKYSISIRRDYPDTWIEIGRGVTIVVSKTSKTSESRGGIQEARP